MGMQEWDVGFCLGFYGCPLWMDGMRSHREVHVGGGDLASPTWQCWSLQGLKSSSLTHVGIFLFILSLLGSSRGQ